MLFPLHLTGWLQNIAVWISFELFENSLCAKDFLEFFQWLHKFSATQQQWGFCSWFHQRSWFNGNSVFKLAFFYFPSPSQGPSTFDQQFSNHNSVENGHPTEYFIICLLYRLTVNIGKSSSMVFSSNSQLCHESIDVFWGWAVPHFHSAPWYLSWLMF